MSGMRDYRETVMITGASRGIGLALTRRFLDAGFQVLACARRPVSATMLQELRDRNSNLRILRLDVSRPAMIRALAGRLSGASIDILINNAGAYGPRDQALETLSDDARPWSQTFATNVMGPFLICRAFSDAVAQSKRKVLASVGSVLGSISEANSGEPYLYRASKAAVHMIMKGLHEDLKGRDIISVALHPGWVRTAMGGPDAPMEPEESADGLFRVLTSLQEKDSGNLLDYRGKAIPW